MSFQVELVWNRESNFVPFGKPHDSLTAAITAAKDIENSGDGACVKKTRVVDDAGDVLWVYGKRTAKARKYAVKQPPYARCAPDATVREIAANWNLSNRPAPVWDKLTADEQKFIIHQTRYPGSSGSKPTPLRSEQQQHD